MLHLLCRISLLFLAFIDAPLPLRAVALAQTRKEDGFVRRQGNKLELNGQDFAFAGANQYFIFYKSRQMVDEVLGDAAQLGLNTLRTWAFSDGQWHEGYSLQPQPRVYDEVSFRNLDYAVYRAKQLGIKLIFTLVNNWDAFGGMNSYVKWSATAHTHDDFYSDYETRAIFKDYIKNLLYRTNYYTGVRYRDEPAILMWELANEPRVDPWRVQDFYKWVDEMGSYIKSIDSNHLVSTGSEGAIATDVAATHQSPSIDIVSFHLYPDQWNMGDSQAVDYIHQQVAAARQLDKPVYCGEFGRRDPYARNASFQSWFREFEQLAIEGALFWSLAGHQDDGSLYPDFDGYTVYYPEHSGTVPIIQGYATKLRGRNNFLTPDH